MLLRKGASQNCGVIVAVVANVADVALVTNISLVTFNSLASDTARGYYFYNLQRYQKTNSVALAWRRSYREPMLKCFMGEVRYETYQ